jgi:hypothetical protein
VIEEDDPQNKIINDFTLKISKRGIYSMHIVKPKDGNRIVIGRALILDELSRKAYSRLDENTRRKFSTDLMLGLIQLKVISAFDPPRPDTNIKTIRLMKSVYYDGLSKDRIFELMNEVWFAYAFVTLKLGEFNVSSSPFDPSQYT